MSECGCGNYVVGADQCRINMVGVRGAQPGGGTLFVVTINLISLHPSNGALGLDRLPPPQNLSLPRTVQCSVNLATSTLVARGFTPDHFKTHCDEIQIETFMLEIVRCSAKQASW